MNDPSDLEDLLPLPHLAYDILLSLAGSDLTVSDLSEEISARTGRRMRSSRADVMGVLRKLVQEDYVQPSALQLDPDNNDDYRRSYTLTMMGMQVAAAETLRMARVLPLAVEKQLVSREQLRSVIPRHAIG